MIVTSSSKGLIVDGAKQDPILLYGRGSAPHFKVGHAYKSEGLYGVMIDRAFTEFPELTTQRLRLRQIRPDDAEAIFATTSDEEAMQFTGHGVHRTIEDTRVYIQRHLALYVERQAILWCITTCDDDRVIGSCSLHHFDEGYHRAEVGYELSRPYWGQGIMPEAVSAILTYGFTQMKLHRIEAIIDDANARSKSLLLKLGFQYEGNLRQRFVSRHGFENEYYYGLLHDEWRP